MTEVKTVKVDNWGSFFLQKLQNFFNKTDYCDLTLQFRDNSQLKVHRLVLSACTDFFNILESSTECMDDILIMPRDLQADVVVPIVNFMYTGTLEFEVRMYDRLLKTARDMKMSVLLKLLEAHRRAMPQKPAPVLLNPGVAGRPALRGGGYTARGRPPRPLPNSVYKRNSGGGMEDETSEFERLRRAGNENPTGKRPLSISARSPSPLQKKPNLQDVKEYTEAALLRKELNVDGDDGAGGDYDVDDHYSQSSGDEGTPRQSVSLLSTGSNKSANTSGTGITTATVTLPETPGQKIDHAKIISEVMRKYPHLLKSNKNIKLKITQKTPGVAGTSFTVQAEATPVSSPKVSTPVGRALMASKQQLTTPKTVATASRSLIAPKPQVIGQSIIKPAASTSTAVVAAPTPPAPKVNPAVKGNRIDSRTMHKLIAMGAENTEGPWLCLRCGVDGKPIGIPSYRAFRKHLINTHHEKIDARLCEHCGQRSKNRQEMYHHVQVTHGIMPPQGVAFPVCKICKHVAVDHTELIKHEKEKHGNSVTASKSPVVKTGDGDDFSCQECDKTFLTRKALTMHVNVKHRGINRIRRAKPVDSEEEDTEEDEDEEEAEEAEEDDEAVDFDKALPEDVDYVPTKAAARKIKVMAKGKSRSSEAEALSTVATGIATSLGLDTDGNSSQAEYHEEEIVDDTRLIEEALANVHGEESKDEGDVETKFLAEDGSELELTHAQKVELMSQLESNGSGEQVVMMYDDEPATRAETSIEENDAEPGQVIKDGDDVLMVYGGPRKDKKKEKEATAAPAKEQVEEGEEEVVEEKEVLVDEAKEKFLKELEGDWTDEGDEKSQDEDKSGKKGEVTVEDLPDLSDDKLDVEEKEDEKVEKAKVGATSGDAESTKQVVGEQSKKGAGESLPEFMNDWEDGEDN